MSMMRVTLKPGENKQLSPTLLQAGVYDTVNVRFRDGIPEKEGGFVPFTNTQLLGVCRAMHDWSDLNGHKDLACGTSSKLYLIQDNVVNDITPLDTFTGTITAASFSTTNGSTAVNVNQAGHSRIAGDYVAFQDTVVGNVLSFNGVTIQGQYLVVLVVDANNYTIAASTTASGTGAGSGDNQTYTYTWNSTLTNPFTTTNASPLVNVAHSAHGRSAGDYVIFSGASAVGGLTINGQYPVTAVVDANNYTITASSNATSSAGPGGGTVAYQYLLPTGFVDNGAAFGWGAGTWDAGTWDTPRSGAGVPLAARIWSLDNWGQDLVALVRGGKAVYAWLTSGGVSTRAQPISGAPAGGLALLVGMPERHLIVVGAETGGQIDPMLVRWSDVEDYTDFIATATNSAGSFRLSIGSQIIAVVETTQQILIFTDEALYSMRFIGTPYVYSFNLLGLNCGAISPNGCEEVAGVVFWMGVGSFYLYNGAIQSLPCTLYNQVFRTLNQQQDNKIYCAALSEFNEVRWHMPTTTNECDSYISFNFSENLWYGTFVSNTQLVRTAFIDHDIFGSPVGTDASGNVWYDQVGVDANGASLAFSMTSGDFDLANGEDFIYTSEVIPDFDPITFGGPVNISLIARKYPFGATNTVGPKMVTTASTILRLPNRGRQVALKIDGNTVGAYMRLGAVRIRFEADGKV